jgi:hypothetical protein
VALFQDAGGEMQVRNGPVATLLELGKPWVETFDPSLSANAR